MEQDLLLKFLNHRLTLSVIGFLQITSDIIHFAAIGQGHHDALVNLTLILVNLLNDRHGHLLHVFHLTLEVAHSHLEDLLAEFLVVPVDKLFAGEGALHGKDLDKLFLAALVVVGLDDVHDTVPDGVRDIHTNTFTHQRVTTLRINHGTLFVHHVIVLQQTLTDTEVVLFDFLLGTFYLFGNHRTLQYFTFFET